MLQTLKIKNIALIESMVIDFNTGLNVFTGETGAGKSIIIDSLNFLLGARADKTLIRHGETFARVDGLFVTNSSNEYIKNFFNTLGLEFENELLISRTMNLEGKNEIRVNGEIITLSMLKDLCSNLVDIYGQNEQLNILKPKFQLSLLDDYSIKTENLVAEYKTLLSNIKILNQKVEEFGGNPEERERELDLLNFQINEIEQANLSKQEEDEILEKRNILANAEKIASLTNIANNCLSSSIESGHSTKSNISSASRYDQKLNEMYERLNGCLIEMNDIQEELCEYTNNLNFNEQEFNKIDERLETYKNLKRKYGNTFEDIDKFYKTAKERHHLLANSSFEIEKLKQQKNVLLKSIYEICKAITNERKNIAHLLEGKILENLQKLGMKNSQIKFNFNSYEFIEGSLLSNGCDCVEILFSANKGEDLKPLKSVASGGEMSRIMLAIKSIIAEKDNMPTMIFDEIDTGISGLMAEAVALQLAKISTNHQVLVITHTAQIASMADTNFLVEKFEEADRTYSKIKKLTFEEKINEIARFLTNSQDLTYAIENSQHLIKEQEMIKLKLKNLPE